MFKCFVCLEEFATTPTLVDHLKIIHLLSSKNELQCKQFDCNQKFCGFRNLRRHLENTHKFDEHFHVGLKSRNCETPAESTQICNESVVAELICNSRTSDPDASSDTEQHIKTLVRKSLLLSLELYAQNSMPRNLVVKIQNMISDLLSSISIQLETLTNDRLQQNDLMSIIQFCKDPFKNFQTEHLFFKTLKEHNLYEYPKECIVDSIISGKIVSGNPTLTEKKCNIYIMPLTFQFRVLFELPGILEATLKNTEKHLSGNRLENFASGKLFKLKVKLCNSKYVIPYILYFDDFQINNPLGGHTHSICACYYSFPTMPQYLLSKLDFIFNAAFISTKELKICGNEMAFHHLVKELIQLENGIEIKTRTGYIKVHFVLGVIVGDNLGLNTILGFVQSFNAKRYCRICTRCKNDMQKDCCEEPEYFRNKDNYVKDLLANNFTETGIKSLCIFNELRSFHVTDNIYFDIMHDIYEGVGVYDVCNILNALISENLITISILNNRKDLFQYGDTEVGNISPPINPNNLNSCNLKMTARESLHFINFLPLLIGDLIPRNNSHWKLLILLVEMVDLLLKPSYTLAELDHLQNVISKHHMLYKSLFGTTLKPKYHFLVHYITAIKNCGPLKYLWCMRFEAKHKAAKIYFNSITSRMNPAYSLSVKAGIQFAKFLQDYESGLKSSYEFEAIENLDLTAQHYYSKITEIDINNCKSVSISNDLVFKGNIYKKSYYLTYKIGDILKLFRIIHFICENKQIFILCKLIEINQFDEHFQSYEVGNQKEEYCIKHIDFFTSQPLHIYQINNGKTYVKNNYL